MNLCKISKIVIRIKERKEKKRNTEEEDNDKFPTVPMNFFLSGNIKVYYLLLS